MKGTSMFSTFSWKQRGIELLAAVVGIVLAHMAAATETVTVRLGPKYRYGEGHLLSDLQSMPRVLTGMDARLQFWIPAVDTCAELLSIPRGSEEGRDTLRETWVRITFLRVECRALSQARPDARVVALRQTDRITLAMINAIIGHLELMSARDDRWQRTFNSFSGGVLTCKNPWRCLLERPDGQNPPEQSLEFDMIMAAEGDRFIAVTQIVHGRSNFVYGVNLAGIQSERPVVSVYFDMN
jgi:hypothetical protein